MQPRQAPSPDAARGRLRVQIVVGWLLVLGFAALSAVLVDYGAYVRLFQAAWLVGFTGFALVVRAVWLLPAEDVPGRWGLWLLGFVLLRVALLHTTPSDDLYRYVWEGEIQRHGFNPYTVPPLDERLRALRGEDENWLRINHPDYPAIYPPVTQLVFRVVARISHSVYVTKAVFVGLELAFIVLLGHLLRLRGESSFRAAVYALCPLSVTAYGIEGHMDSLLLLWLVVAAFFAARNSFYVCSVAVGLAVASKLVAVVLLPWLIMKKPCAALPAVAVAAAAYIPFADAGREVFTSLTRFAGTTTSLALFVGPLEAIGGGMLARGVCAALLACWLVYLAVLRLDYCTYATRALAGLVLLMPVVHLWYLTWFLVFAWARLRVTWLVLTAAMVFYLEGERMRALTGEWRLPAWVCAGVYAPFLIAGALENRRRKRTSRPAESD